MTALRAGSIVAEVLLFEGLHPEGLRFDSFLSIRITPGIFHVDIALLKDIDRSVLTDVLDPEQLSV